MYIVCIHVHVLARTHTLTHIYTHICVKQFLNILAKDIYICVERKEENTTCTNCLTQLNKDLYRNKGLNEDRKKTSNRVIRQYTCMIIVTTETINDKGDHDDDDDDNMMMTMT